jgi:phospholipase/carboxylesterase
MIHVYKKGSNGITFVLLHSAGGDENELIDVAKMIDPNANILAIRGSINEYGANRFFKRKSLGKYDEDSLTMETHKLTSFIRESSKAFSFDMTKIVLIGNGSGATLGINCLFHYEKVFHKVILFHPRIPRRPYYLPDLKQVNIFMTAGENDYMTPKHEVLELTQILNSANAHVDLYFTKYGHQLSKDELEASQKWYIEGHFDHDFSDET